MIEDKVELAKNKLILVFYVNIKRFEYSHETHKYLVDFKSEIGRAIDESILAFVFPVTDSKTRVECVNPSLFTDVEYDRFSALFDYHEHHASVVWKQLLDKFDKDHKMEIPEEIMKLTLIQRVKKFFKRK